MKDIFAPLIIALVLSVLFTISSRYRAQKDENGDYILMYAMPIKIFGAVFLSLGVVVTYLFLDKFINKGTEDMISLFICAIIFIGMLLCLAVEFFYVKYSLNKEFICSNTPWSRKRIIFWKDVSSIHYSESFRWFVIEDKKTKPIRIGAMVSGIDKFLEIAEAHTNESVYKKLQESLNNKR